MAEINVKLFGVMRIDSGAAQVTVNANTIEEVFEKVTEELLKTNGGNKELLSQINFNEAIVYLNGKRCASKRKKITASDDVWLMSPASGG